MLLFKLRSNKYEMDTGSNGTDTTATESVEETTETQSDDVSLESIMSGKKSTQTEPNSDNGNGQEDTTTNNKQLPAWIQQLPKEMRTDDMNQFAQISDLVKSYQELAEDKGKQSQAPGPDAKPEEVQAFYEKLGKPKTASEYNIEGTKDEPGTQMFKEVAFKANLTNQQAQDMHKAFAEVEIQEIRKRQEAMTQEKNATDKLLHDEYGTKYKEKLASLQRGVNQFVSPSLNKVLIDNGLLFNAELVKMLITLGEATSEANSNAHGGTKQYVPLSEGGMFEFKDLDL